MFRVGHFVLIGCGGWRWTFGMEVKGKGRTVGFRRLGIFEAWVRTTTTLSWWGRAMAEGSDIAHHHQSDGRGSFG